MQRAYDRASGDEFIEFSYAEWLILGKFGQGAIAKGVKILKKLAANNYPMALRYLGRLNLNGNVSGIVQNIHNAFKYYHKASMLGDLYSTGLITLKAFNDKQSIAEQEKIVRNLESHLGLHQADNIIVYAMILSGAFEWKCFESKEAALYWISMAENIVKLTNMPNPRINELKTKLVSKNLLNFNNKINKDYIDFYPITNQCN